MSKANHRRKGFTLPEITISIAIVAVVLLPILGILATGSALEMTSKDRESASRIASSFLGEMGFDPSAQAIAFPMNDFATFLYLPVPSSGSESWIYCGMDENGKFVRELTEREIVESPTNSEEMLYGVRFQLTESPNSRAGMELYRLNLYIEQPLEAAEKNRERETFSTQVGTR